MTGCRGMCRETFCQLSYFWCVPLYTSGALCTQSQRQNVGTCQWWMHHLILLWCSCIFVVLCDHVISFLTIKFQLYELCVYDQICEPGCLAILRKKPSPNLRCPSWHTTCSLAILFNILLHTLHHPNDPI